MGLTLTEIGLVKFLVGQEIKRKSQGYNIDQKYITELETILDKLHEYRRS